MGFSGQAAKAEEAANTAAAITVRIMGIVISP
jgi:hypothetical protein